MKGEWRINPWHRRFPCAPFPRTLSNFPPALISRYSSPFSLLKKRVAFGHPKAILLLSRRLPPKLIEASVRLRRLCQGWFGQTVAFLHPDIHICVLGIALGSESSSPALPSFIPHYPFALIIDDDKKGFLNSAQLLIWAEIQIKLKMGGWGSRIPSADIAVISMEPTCCRQDPDPPTHVYLYLEM